MREKLYGPALLLGTALGTWGGSECNDYLTDTQAEYYSAEQIEEMRNEFRTSALVLGGSLGYLTVAAGIVISDERLRLRSPFY